MFVVTSWARHLRAIEGAGFDYTRARGELIGGEHATQLTQECRHLYAQTVTILLLKLALRQSVHTCPPMNCSGGHAP